MSGPPDRVEAPFQHTGLVGRYPTGTDPRRAVRETMTEFMTRTDGTNDLPWWLRSDVTWWHGSGDGIRVGTELMPPSITGIMPHLPYTDTASVYVTRLREDALMYSCWHRRPMLYEVSFADEPQPDDVLADPNSFRVPRATVRRVHGVTRPEVEAAMRRVLELPDRDDSSAR